jgi:C-terminal processing protease CtpA/Prc
LVVVGIAVGLFPGCGLDDREAKEHVRPGCEDADACRELCGIVANECGVEVDCGSCIDAETLAAMMDIVDSLLSTLGDQGYMTDLLDIDEAALREEAVTTLRNTPDNDLGLLTSLSQALQTYRNGHSSVGLTTSYCRDAGGADVSMTAYGVCAKPYKDHFVVTHQPGTRNPLGLSPGDRVVALNGRHGDAMVDAIMSGALCTNGAGNDDVRHEHAAESLFSTIRVGDELTVIDALGTERSVVVQTDGSGYVECRFPAGSINQPLIDVETRADGVAVMRLRRFFLFSDEPGYIEVTTEEELWEYVDNMIEKIRTEFAAVEPLATGIIWDVRGNIGGASPVGFEIAAGMPGAASTPLARCTTRIPGTNPAEYWQMGPDYDLTPSSTFATSKRTAVLTDGLTISAGDYFALAVRLGTEAAIFGRPTAGAFGGGGAWTHLDSEQKYFVAYDPYRCNDLTGEALEMRSTQPDTWVEYEPEDLAAGIDTVLETAAQWVAGP